MALMEIRNSVWVHKGHKGDGGEVNRTEVELKQGMRIWCRWLFFRFFRHKSPCRAVSVSSFVQWAIDALTLGFSFEPPTDKSYRFYSP